MIHYTREAVHFPHGFSLSEFVEGENCKAAVRRGSLAPAAYMELAGAVLRKVHAVGPALYGYIGDGRGMYEDFTGWLLDCDVEDALRRVDEATAETLYPLIARNIEPVLRRYESRFRPALVHGDCTPKNALLTDAGGLVFVDWDDAVGGFWVRDYAALTYWYSYMRVGGGVYDDTGLDEARAAFFRGYGEPGFDADELREVEWALHVSMAAGEMSYLHTSGDAQASARSRGLLTLLLDTPPARRV
jgi:Ser/Thr protein kinase RdoA (MazF antagonist)